MRMSRPLKHMRETKDGGIKKEQITELITKVKGLKTGKEGEEPMERVRKEMDVFLTSEEGKESGETEKVVVLEEEWIEGETEPKVFQTPRKGIDIEGKSLTGRIEDRSLL